MFFVKNLIISYITSRIFFFSHSSVIYASIIIRIRTKITREYLAVFPVSWQRAISAHYFSSFVDFFLSFCRFFYSVLSESCFSREYTRFYRDFSEGLRLLSSKTTRCELPLAVIDIHTLYEKSYLCNSCIVVLFKDLLLTKIFFFLRIYFCQ